jgi:hypothetical protein
MRGKLAVTLLIGVVIGVALALTLGRPQALAQQGKTPQRWEYKVVVFAYSKDEMTKGQVTKLLNELADEGWEYVGLVGTSIPRTGSDIAHESSVAFRRPKQ